MVFEAGKRGELRPGFTIEEVTSGNTGIALAMVGAMRGYQVVVMPKTVSDERRSTITSFGASLELFDDIDDMQDAIARTEAFAAQHDDVFLPRQFANPDNVETHRTTTGPEILRQVKGEIDAFVMGIGTGGAVMGVGRALRKAGSRARIVAVEPDESAVLSDGFIPALVNLDELDQVVRISTRDAIDAAQQIGVEEGLLVGISSGANVLAATQVAAELGPGHNVVTVLCDRGERYMSAIAARAH